MLKNVGEGRGGEGEKISLAPQIVEKKEGERKGEKRRKMRSRRSDGVVQEKEKEGGGKKKTEMSGVNLYLEGKKGGD